MKIIFFFIILIYATGCQNNQKAIEKRDDQTTVFSGQKMTIDYKIIVGSELDAEKTQVISKLIDETFKEVDRVYNKWNPHSEISHLNTLKAGIDHSISPSLEHFLQVTHSIVELTEGRFDPTIEPLQNLWKQKLQQQSIPTNEEIAAISPAIGWDKIHFGKGTFRKDHDLTEIDLGGIAKGLCVDLLVERLNAEGFPSVYVEWGGEIRVSGRHPSGRLWTVFISRLGNTDHTQAITLLALENQAIATSGDYLQNWSMRLPDATGKHSTTTYFHIFDPKALQPLKASYTSIASASVVAPSCAFADGLATAAMMLPSLTEGQEWAHSMKEKFPDLSFWLISREKAGNLNEMHHAI